MKLTSIGYRIMLGLALAGLLAFGLASSSQAADFRGGDNVVIGADEVIDDDLFFSGNRLEMNGTVKGDLFASGAEIIINGQVEGSLAIAGRTLQVGGQVDGSVYGGGYSLTIEPEARVGRNLYFGGFSLEVGNGSTIGRSLYAGNYQTILNGNVARDVSVGSGALEINGTVGGDVQGEVSREEGGAPPPFMPTFPGQVEAIPPGLRINESAQIGGEVGVREIRADGGQPDNVLQGFLWAVARTITQRVGEFIALLIVGGLLLYFWPKMVQRGATQAQENPLPSAGWGCLVSLVFFIGVPVVAAIIFVLALLGGVITFGQLFNDILSLGGAMLGMVVATFVFVLSLVTKAVVVFLGGRLILTRLASQMQPGWMTDFWALALGAFLYEILRAIPLGLGWVIGVIVTLVGLGAIYFVVRETIQPSLSRPAPVSEATS